MSVHIMKCPSCDEYMLNEQCACREKTLAVKPPKFSPEDKYSGYRRLVKKNELIKKGML